MASHIWGVCNVCDRSRNCDTYKRIKLILMLSRTDVVAAYTDVDKKEMKRYINDFELENSDIVEYDCDHGIFDFDGVNEGY